MPHKPPLAPTHPACPRCGRSDAVAPVAYGLLTNEGVAAAHRDGIIIGGCMPGLPLDCSRCNIRFDEGGTIEPGPPRDWWRRPAGHM